MKSKKLLWIIGGIALIIVIMNGNNFKLNNTQVVTGSETMTRTSNSQVNAGSTFDVTYTAVGATGQWGATIIEDVTGCTPAYKETLFIHDTGDANTKSVTYTAPSSGSCTFTGNYQFGSQSIKTFTSKTVTICTSHSSYACDSGDVYWFNSCSVKEDLKQDCAAGCSGGICSCNTDADTDCNGVISTLELQTYGQKWLNSQITRTQIGQAIQAWAAA